MNGLVLVPFEPQFRTILHKAMGDSETTPARRKSHLYFPYSVFGLMYAQTSERWFQTTRLYVGFSKKPFTGDREEELYGLPLDNIDSGFGICLGATHLSARSLKELVQKTIAYFWASPFVYDGSSDWKYMYSSNFCSRWRKATRENRHVAFFKRVQLKGAPYIINIGKLIDSNKSAIGGNVQVLRMEDQ
jgi:hypothetical protein